MLADRDTPITRGAFKSVGKDTFSQDPTLRSKLLGLSFNKNNTKSSYIVFFYKQSNYGLFFFLFMKKKRKVSFFPWFYELLLLCKLRVIPS